GGRETQPRQIALGQARGRRQRRRLLGANGFAQALQRQLVGQQLLEGQAPLRPVPPLGQLGEIGARRRAVQVANRLVQRTQLEIPRQFRWQPVGQAVGGQARQ